VTDAGENSAGPASAGPAEEGRGGNGSAQERPAVVVRDKRRIDAGGKPKGKPSPGTERSGAAAAAPEQSESAEATDDAAETAEATADADAETAVEVPSPLGAELEALRAEMDERTKDLQRLSAEYANYRKRVDRDRGVVAEQVTGAVLAQLLPVLDDIDRAREHGDLVGPFASVAEQLLVAISKFGLTPFGEKGDPFDPKRHEAVAHLTSADVSEPTCVDVMRRGYLLGERLLRPALVAVADPE
jgi:molecular chaperone GrpE